MECEYCGDEIDCCGITGGEEYDAHLKECEKAPETVK